MEIKKLYRSRSDRMFAGVCGGLGKYLGIDATLIRLLFALLVVVGVGSGILIYFVLMVVVPLEPETIGPAAEPPAAVPAEPPSEAPKSE